MKTSDIKNMSKAELQTKEAELREDLFRLKFKHATGNMENPAQIGQVRKDIARIKTILTQKEAEVQ